MANNSKANFFKGASTRSKLATKCSSPPEYVSPAETPDSDPLPNRSEVKDPSTGKNIDQNMFEEIQKMSATLQVVAGDVVVIKGTTKELKDSVAKIQERLGEAEQQISDIEDMHAGMEKSMEKCDKRLEILRTYVEDLENISRRNNIRMVGLKEGKEQTGKVAQYAEKILYEGLGPSDCRPHVWPERAAS